MKSAEVTMRVDSLRLVVGGEEVTLEDEDFSYVDEKGFPRFDIRHPLTILFEKAKRKK
jgi:hypothetical protein